MAKDKIVEKKEEKALFKVDLSQEIPPLPEYKNKEDTDIRYPLIAPYAYAHIYWDAALGEIIYKIEEPELDDREKKVLELLEDGVRELINLSFISVQERNEIINYLEKNVKVILNEMAITLSPDSFLKLMYFIYRDFVGLNEVEPLLNDYYIEDIECNGADSPIYIVHRKYRNLKTSLIYGDLKLLTSFVEKLAQKAGKYISYASPLLDGALPDGSRVNATYTQEISSKGPTYTIRKFTKEPWSPIQLMDKGTVSPEILAYLWLMVEYEKNIMVIGGTGSGKTTFINVVAFFIPPQARVVSIEDTRELQLNHENWLPSVSRPGIGLASLSGQKQGEVSLFDLLKESFRQRPDYIIVGEIRGVEAYVLFQGMASGHPSMGTMHAEDVRTMIRRLETPPINLSPALVESMDVVCIMSQNRIKGKIVRKLSEVDEIVEVKEGVGNERINTPFIWDPRTDKFFFKAQSKTFEKIMIHYGLNKEQLYNELKLRTLLLMKLQQQKIFEFREVQKIIDAYYKNPEEVLKRFKII